MFAATLGSYNIDKENISQRLVGWIAMQEKLLVSESYNYVLKLLLLVAVLTDCLFTFVKIANILASN